MAIVSVIFEERANNLIQFGLTNPAEFLFDAFLGINLLTNLTLTGLIAARLWWSSRSMQKYLGYDSPHGRRTNNIVAMVLESGSIYPVALIACIIVLQLNKPFSVPVESVLTIIVGIAPTLIIVRVDLGISMKVTSGPSSDADSTVLQDLEGEPSSYLHPFPPDLEAPQPNFLLPVSGGNNRDGTAALPSNAVPQKYCKTKAGEYRSRTLHKEGPAQPKARLK
ncbi:hypothetical protein GYMLUDRAFT_250663 [Collybiopsis luxurians FD-317 M1]|uniref:Uncharacterized protein n=1 Tax=Collybiopsis luxurians FD-317 M1 TaxID=944289 RepID=A0A0D0BEP7_9AGAR|nr:hypothetical protein GYMLUDRAFT_250663 [Collybiopsis luxurians FD-317 M1]